MAANVLFLGRSHLRWSHQYPISLHILIKGLLGVTCLVMDIIQLLKQSSVRVRGVRSVGVASQLRGTTPHDRLGTRGALEGAWEGCEVEHEECTDSPQYNRRENELGSIDLVRSGRWQALH